MSISQFVLENSKRTFYYDNELHAILDQDRVMLSLPALQQSDYYEQTAQQEGVRWKNNTPKALRILLIASSRVCAVVINFAIIES